jgi:hypothetical protein
VKSPSGLFYGCGDAIEPGREGQPQDAAWCRGIFGKTSRMKKNISAYTHDFFSSLLNCVARHAPRVLLFQHPPFHARIFSITAQTAAVSCMA